MDVPVEMNHERTEAEPTAGSIMVDKILEVEENGKKAKNATTDEYPSQSKPRWLFHSRKTPVDRMQQSTRHCRW